MTMIFETCGLKVISDLIVVIEVVIYLHICSIKIMILIQDYINYYTHRHVVISNNDISMNLDEENF